MSILVLVVGATWAQSCSCSVGGGEAVTPAGRGPGAGGLTLTLDYGAAQLGGDASWSGFAVVDRLGNSMPTMHMPGHLAQTVRGTVVVGATDHVALTASIPWIDSHPLFPSDMPGDEDANFPGDAALGVRWTETPGKTTVGLGVGTTLPTGRVLEGGGARGGRGAVGVTARAELMHAVSSHVELGGSANGAASLYPAPVDDYSVGPTLSGSIGARLRPQTGGRLRLDEFAVATVQGHDRVGRSDLDQTGIVALSAASGASYRFWGRKGQSASVQARGQLPLFQVVGDPWLAQNWTFTAGISIVAL